MEVDGKGLAWNLETCFKRVSSRLVAIYLTAILLLEITWKATKKVKLCIIRAQTYLAQPQLIIY